MSLWFRLTATVRPELVEAVSHAMLLASPGGIEVEEPVDILGPEQGFRVRSGENVLIHAYVPSGELGAVLVDDLRRRMEAFPGVELVARPINQEDWATNWRDFFGVVDPGGRAVVVPTWIDEGIPAGKLVVRLDPGQAFGTGHHETSRLCLLALEDHVRPGCNFLDLGTGSGILAISAVLLGAGRGTALDIDPAAAEIARQNVAANGVAGAIAVRPGVLDLDHEQTYDLVVANIFADPLIALAPAFARVVRPGGVLILSGVIATDAARVSAAMTAAGFERLALRHERDWCALEFRAPAPGQAAVL